MDVVEQKEVASQHEHKSLQGGGAKFRPRRQSQVGGVAEERVRFVELAASARAFMSAVRALSNPPRANEQLNGCGRSFRASSRQRASCGRASATELSLELRSTSDGGSRPKSCNGLSSSRIHRMMYATPFESKMQPSARNCPQASRLGGLATASIDARGQASAHTLQPACSRPSGGDIVLRRSRAR